MNLNKQENKRFIDLSHTVEHGMITYKDLPAPLICDYLSREESRKHYSEGTQFQIGKSEMVANTGTYLDSPFHRYAGGIDLSQLPLSSIADLDAIVFRTNQQSRREIDASLFVERDVSEKAVLIHTGWDAIGEANNISRGIPF